ncbi:hypothetical protein GSB9_00086 [Flavobacteriaceae bacterium GSB9]|nr:hypothetical protein GSB9_00086 [Flavobacteriaceae bacterium GSB9]
MDELELLKKGWHKQPGHKKLTVTDIYPMLHRKSSSIVKTLFYISVAELVFWILVNTIPYFTSDAYRKRLDDVYTDDILFTWLTVFSFAVIVLFIYLLYKSYKSISVTDSARQLMESILRTRKIIKYYVLYNLVMAGVSLLIGFYFAFTHNPELANQVAHFSKEETMMATAIIVISTVVFILVIWLFYKLIYGLLLKRLNRNYRELKRLDD